MNQKYAVIVLFALILASGFTSYRSYSDTKKSVTEDMDRALALTMLQQQSDVISQDTIRVFNSHLQMAKLRGKATLAVDTRQRRFKAYAQCSSATIFSLSDQRPSLLLWTLASLWAMFCWFRRRRQLPVSPVVSGSEYGGLIFSDTERRFFATTGEAVKLTPMQHQLMEMFFKSPTHSLTKSEICSALWPKKDDANETLYTLIRRLKPVVEQHSDLKIESDRSKAYRLTIRQIEN
ncbi:MAG: helix-turn-helix domain-containing protein [Prevotella sp.]|nr:helix-turn-helix domain-containing protein [Prevotella sp.]